MRATLPTDAEITAAIERAAAKCGIEHEKEMVQAEWQYVYREDGLIDWSKEIEYMRALVAHLPHRHDAGTPGSHSSSHYIETGHRLHHGCCTGQYFS